jgi:lipoprotein-anchoring transpeptidase ErfK/SrfK
MWSHWSRGVMVSVLAGACCVGAAAAVAATTRSGSSTPKPTEPRPVAVDVAKGSHSRELAGSVRITPASGTNVAPDAPIVVTAGTGRLATVRVASNAGAAVAGMLSPSGTRWQSTGRLDYGTSYRVTVTATGDAGAHAELTSTFRTLTPATPVGVTVFPTDGLQVGVGQPIVFRFDQPISTPAAQAAVQSHLDVTESQPVVGGWHWFSDTELHFRPQAYWPAHEQITVAWDLRDWNAGNGMWGNSVGVQHFSVGDARVSLANLVTHQMTVTDDGKVVATYPISGGKPTDPTMDGTHIVLDRESVVRMDSATNGVPVNSPDGYDELVYSDAHISDSGEYVHAAPWSVSNQGVSNVSHGCINLSPANAAAFFAFSHVGDVVLVGGSPRPPALGDHGVMDWDTAWNGFAPANVILHAPASIAGLG